jgi:hypothetical protein
MDDDDSRRLYPIDIVIQNERSYTKPEPEKYAIFALKIHHIIRYHTRSLMSENTAPIQIAIWSLSPYSHVHMAHHNPVYNLAVAIPESSPGAW